jgi:hypothetical protein
MQCKAAEGGAGEEGEERRRDEGTWEGAKEVARTAGGKVSRGLGDRGMRWKRACYGRRM